MPTFLKHEHHPNCCPELPTVKRVLLIESMFSSMQLQSFNDPSVNGSNSKQVFPKIYLATSIHRPFGREDHGFQGFIHDATQKSIEKSQLPGEA